MKKIFTLFAVAAMAFAAQANEVTVCNGTDWSANLPIYGYYYDAAGTMGQMIYPAEMLTDMNGGKITALKFYADGTFGADQGAMQLSLMEVDATGFVTTTAMTGATVVDEGVGFTRGESELVFEFDTPYEYNGGNLLVEVLVTEAGIYGSNYYLGVSTAYYPSFYSYYWWYQNDYRSSFLPKATFTYEGGTTPVEPTVQADAPEIGVTYGTDGNHVATVTINSNEENATIYYSYDNENWMEYEDELLFTEDGVYLVYAYVSVPGKLDSEVNYVRFVVTPQTGMTDLMTGKTIASQRFYNIAGQEMKEANGLTIVVTNYTDGTTSTAKVVK